MGIYMCVCPGGVAVTVSVATVDKAVYRGGAGNDAGTTETSVGEVSLLLLADLITSHTFQTQPHNNFLTHSQKTLCASRSGNFSFL